MSNLFLFDNMRFHSNLILPYHQEVFFVTDNSETFVDTSSVINNRIERTAEESGWTIAAANGTNSTIGMNNMLIENNTNVKVSACSARQLVLPRQQNTSQHF